MRKIRRRLLMILLVLTGCSSAATLLISWMAQNNILFMKSDIHVLIMGYALKELIIFALVMIIMILAIFLLSKRTADPIEELSRAANEIAEGNYDITLHEPDRKDELGRLFSDFNRMAHELQSNEILKKNFISNVSHEFKTPLSIMEGYAKLLTEDQITDEQRKTYATLIKEESHRLSGITGKMLKLSRITSSDSPLKLSSFYLDEQIRQVILTLEPAWSKKNLDLQLQLDPVKFKGDKDLLPEVWMNLIENAIKFSPDNGVLEISLKPYPNRIVFSVKDHGCGMDASTQEKIFEQFFQGDTSHRREGSGLGLSIVKQIVTLHNGQIKVLSEPNQGSEFLVVF